VDLGPEAEMIPRVVVAVAIALAALASGGVAAQEKLAVPPLDLTVTPASLLESEPATIRIVRIPGTPTGADEALDLHLVRYVGWRQVVFLTPDGEWTEKPTPFRRGVRLASFTPVEATWPPWRGPVGSVNLALIVVRASDNPLARTSWLYQPVFRLMSRRAAAEPALEGARRLEAGVLGGATIAACVLVLLYGSGTRARPRERAS
jgi:hypothetical protein